MGKQRIRGLILILSISLFVLVGSAIARSAISKKENIKEDTIRPSKITNENLLKEISDYGKLHKIEPVDAKIDRVWKAIPGYNGLIVNVQASYEKMEEAGAFDISKIVYEEVPPKIHLEDLDPQPIYRGNLEKPMIALLINVAWGDEYIPAILSALDNHKVMASFFFDGSWVKKNPSEAKMIMKAGHEIGNHAYSHPDLAKYTAAQITEELQKTNDVIVQTLGIKPKWFAPPSGSFNNDTIQVAHELGMGTILWTVDTVDWRKPETWEMVSRVVGKVENGSMILMHPTKPTAEGLNEMITQIKSKGYCVGTVSDLMSEKRVNPTKTQD